MHLKSQHRSYPWIRDNPAVADMLVTGVDTRIASAKMRFERFYERAKSASPVPVKLISVSLFGFDLGATLARKFLDSLLKDICKKEGINTPTRAYPSISSLPACLTARDARRPATTTAWITLSLRLAGR